MLVASARSSGQIGRLRSGCDRLLSADVQRAPRMACCAVAADHHRGRRLRTGKVTNPAASVVVASQAVGNALYGLQRQDDNAAIHSVLRALALALLRITGGT